MPDFLETGMGWLADVFEDNISQSITYTRGTTTVSLSASVSGGINAMGADFGGTQLKRDEMDFMVKAASLGFEPREDDRITYGTNVYRACKPDVNARCFADDEYGIGYVIHTKRIGTT